MTSNKLLVHTDQIANAQGIHECNQPHIGHSVATATRNSRQESGKNLSWDPEEWFAEEEDQVAEERGRRSGAHSGLILTFHSVPGLPVSCQMNGNCPAGFNHVLNWRKNRRKALLRQLGIDRAGSRTIAGPLYRGPSRAHTHARPCMSTLTSEQRTEALITALPGEEIKKKKQDTV